MCKNEKWTSEKEWGERGEKNGHWICIFFLFKCTHLHMCIYARELTHSKEDVIDKIEWKHDTLTFTSALLGLSELADIHTHDVTISVAHYTRRQQRQPRRRQRWQQQQQQQRQQQPCNDGCRQKNKHTVWPKRRRVWSKCVCTALSLSRSLAFGVCAKKIEHNLFKSVCTLHLYMPFISGTITSSQRMSRCDIGNIHTHTYSVCVQTHTHAHMCNVCVLSYRFEKKSTRALTLTRTVYFFLFQIQIFSVSLVE